MARLRQPIAIDRFWQISLLVMALRAMPGPLGFLAYAVTLFYGLRGRRQGMEALLLSWYITLANPSIFGSIPYASLGRFAVIFGVSGTVIIRIMARSRPRVSRAAMATLVLTCFVLVHSVLFSEVVPVSVLKGLSWGIAMLSIILCFSDLSEGDFQLIESHIYGFLILVIALSLAAYLALPAGRMFGYSYLRGILGHSQATGVVGALIAIWAFSRALDRSQSVTFEFSVFACANLVVFLSGARTALLSIGAAMLVVWIVAAIRGRRPLRRLLGSARSPLVALGFTGVIFGAILNAGTVGKALDTFLSKDSGSNTLSAAYAASRGELIEEMMANIRNDPLIGIGFGIASDPGSMVVERIGGIPVSAAVEKGVTFVAMWEETGLIGLILTVYWMTIIFSRAIGAELAQTALLIGIFLQNLGEATLFSVGGMGMLSILLIGYCSYRLRNSSRRRRVTAGVPRAQFRAYPPGR